MVMTEIRIFSRGGQGGVTAAKLLAYAASLEGYEVQAIPKYGAERKGAPIFVDVRIADHPIRTHSPVSNADHYVVLEPSLVEQLPDEFKENALIVINSNKLSDKDAISGNFGTVDAYKIADETHLVKSGTRLVSTIMLGAWAKASNNLVSMSSIEASIKKSFKGTVVDDNISAINKAYEGFTFIKAPVIEA